MRILEILLIVFTSHCALAQNVPVRINEKIGYMIDKQENKDYGFFTQCPADSFLYAKIYADSSAGTHTAQVYFKSATQHIYPLGAAELDTMKAQASQKIIRPKQPYAVSDKEGEAIVGLGRLIYTIACYFDKQ
ncbi:MAG: hypothetical protein FD123_2208 [Bacteroidetes bacterium]|nr:MAG: hypothetical protein FD123_2208 [Bacteroidota bacterium]